ncbi:MAG: winged helix-turn-helix domain-containing protein [Gammaproteobacteria bacterium]
MKKPKTVSEKTAPKPQTRKTVATETKPAASKKPATRKVSAKKPEAEAASVAPDATMPERVGQTAGEIWRYLDNNGATPVAVLIKELSEEEKIIQRSLGWLAREGTLSIEAAGRIETVNLKG